MAPLLTCEVSESVWRALQDEQSQSGESLSRIVDRALAGALDLDRHSLFQVSTSSALVRGVFRGAVTVGDLKRHGYFGLGTFGSLDGELVMLEGLCHRATLGGSVTIPGDDTAVSFAVITRFSADLSSTFATRGTLADLTAAVDELRPSENLFVGIRVDGAFEKMMMRAVCPAAPGEGLVDAVGHQSEFVASNVEGTLVGFWAPLYATAINIPGYHFHFLSADRSVGGHVLGLKGGRLDIGVHVESALHLAIPETAEFLQADLSGEHRLALDQAETQSRLLGDQGRSDAITT